jgi:acetyl-CoA acetyltransferase
MRDTVIAGVGMTSFGKFVDRSYASLTGEAIGAALRDSNAQASEIQQVYYSNSTAGLIYGQESVRGQHAVRGSGLDGVPLINVENACASGATALKQAWLSVASGQVDIAGLAQIVELADQLRGRCGTRQIEDARIGLAENAGGYIRPDAAAAAVVILSRM